MPGEEPLYEWWNEESEVWESTHKEYFDAKTGSYDHSYRESCGVFTLQDMLEMMPKDILANDKSYTLCINPIFVAYINLYLGEIVRTLFETLHYGNFLKGAYQILCWLTENGHLKGGKP